MKFKSKIISVSLIANLTIYPLVIPNAFASDYNAICDQVGCFVKLDDKGIKSPNGFMPYEGVTSWTVAEGVTSWTVDGDDENTSSGILGAAGALSGATGGAIVGAAAACTTIVLCPVAIIGGGIIGGRKGSKLGSSSRKRSKSGSNSYYSFIINGYDKEGYEMSHSFDIDKKKIMKKIMKTLKKNSGLSMGEDREVNVYEIMGYEAPMLYIGE